MESVSLTEAKEIFGTDFIGLEELQPFFLKLNKTAEVSVPGINYSKETLLQSSGDYVLILTIPQTADGWPINILNLRDTFGMDEQMNIPCFYNQDWYIKETFVMDTLPLQWRLVRKKVLEDSRGIMPDNILEENKPNQFPSAILCIYTFFAYYYLNNKILWEQDFIWCSDKDINCDRIYVGRYFDPTGVARNGFSIHRHLSLRKSYGTFFLK